MFGSNTININTTVFTRLPDSGRIIYLLYTATDYNRRNPVTSNGYSLFRTAVFAVHLPQWWGTPSEF
jgi:hypothetical protein